VIHENRIELLDETWRPPSGGGQGKGKGKGRSGVTTLLAAAYLATRQSSSGGGTRRAKLDRLTRRVPEVMVKVTGRQRGGGHTAAHLDYIARHGKLDVETSDGERITGKANVESLANEWSAQEELTTRRREPLTSISMILSMPPGSDPEIVRHAARAFARTELEQFPWAMALHTDTDHPHVHLTIAARGEDDARFDPRKADLARYREVFARELRARGQEAEATPRRARAVVQKHETTPVRKMRERAEEGRGEMPLVLQAARRVSSNLMTEDPLRPRPWEMAIVKRQSEVRTAHQTVAAELISSDDPADKRLGEQTLVFLANLPSPATRDRQASFDLAAGRRELDRSQGAESQRAKAEPRPPTATAKPREIDGPEI